jgi:outer membrane protein TolC
VAEPPASQPATPEKPQPGPEKLPPPKAVFDEAPAVPNPLDRAACEKAMETAAADAAAAGMPGALPISLPVALRLAWVANLDIAQAREVVAQARAALQRAQVAVLPNFNLGSTYTHHEGNIQKTEGNIIKANRDSLFVGGGPSVSFSFAEAIFLPLAARQIFEATQAGLQRVNNDTFLAVADAYLSVLRARRRLARIDETLDYLLSTVPAPSRSESKGLFPLMRDFVETGAAEAVVAELERVRVEVMRRQEERVAILQDFRTASAELARLLRLDPAVPLWPLEDFRVPMPLPGEAWMAQPVEELAVVALSNRPEVAESRAVVRAAFERLRTARFRPLLPNVVMNYSWGDFGGSPDPNPPIVRGTTVVTQPGFGPSGRILHFNTRTDFDAALVWRLQNLGFGNLAEVRQLQAEYRQLDLRRLQTLDRILAQVVQAYEGVVDWRERMAISRSALFDNQGRPTGPVFESLRLTFDRIRSAPGTRTLEALDSIRSLNDLLDAYGQAVTDYERARFRLLIALGMPAQGLIDPAAMPVPAQPGDVAGCPHPDKDRCPPAGGQTGGGGPNSMGPPVPVGLPLQTLRRVAGPAP